jgi:predicted anti-sigma-YlaC factor YlaD
MDQPLTLRENFRRRFHFLSCSVCRGFQKQMLSLTALVRMSVATREAEQPDPEFLLAVRQELTRVAGESEQSGPTSNA